MAERSVPELLPLINQQIDFHETLNEYLAKAQALAHVAMSDDFLDYPELIIHYYLWVLSDVVENAKRLSQVNEDSLNFLVKNISLKNDFTATI